MAEERLVEGDGWVSDDSSLYGDHDEQDLQLSLGENFNPEFFWAMHDRDLNRFTTIARALDMKTDGLANMTVTPQSKTREVAPGPAAVLAIKPFHMSGLDRKAMEQERLARVGKQGRDLPKQTSPDPELFNLRQGCADAWQLGESVNDFIKRLPPAATSLYTCPWIWVENPHRKSSKDPVCPQIDQFTREGLELLDNSYQKRLEIQSKSSQDHKGVLSKSLNQESKALQQNIAHLATKHYVLSGKWMLFPKAVDVTRVWKQIVQAVINDRLGPTAKVATDNGNDERLICVYTRDFNDVDDVLRVLQELGAMCLLNPGRSLYYKHDAYTYLDLKSGTAAQYGLQASLYNSRTMMAAGSLPKASSRPGKSQSTLNKYF